MKKNYAALRVGNYRISENVSIFRLYMYRLFTIAVQKDQIENRTPKMLISPFKFKLYVYFDCCFIFKTPITQNSKIICFANWRKR